MGLRRSGTDTWIPQTTLAYIEPVGHFPVGHRDIWEPGEGSGTQGKSAETHFGKGESQDGSMSPQHACALQADMQSRYLRGR